jgi:hypothetical protein
MDTELIFTKEGLTIRSPVKVPIVGDSVHEERIGYDKLPADGMMMTVTSIDKKLDESGRLTSLVFRVSSFQLLRQAIEARAPNRIEIELTPTSLRYHLIPLNKSTRNYFPGFKIPFDLQTNIGVLRCHVSGGYGTTQQGDPHGGQYMVGGLRRWFEKNKVKPGEKLFIDVIELGKKYRLVETAGI